MADFDSSSAVSGNSRHKNPHSDSLLNAGVKIDMTPMVDVIMLLLTFFMLTTTLAMPQAMQINLPKGDEHVAVNMGNIATIRVSEKGNIFLSQGLESGRELPPEKVSFADIGSRLTQLSKSNSNLLLFLKFDRNMKYKTMVDILDEINMSVEKDNRRFSIKKMEAADLEIVKEAEGS
ncbi:MAG: biopolymer transporter ExbD [Bacteroidetes bacterium]|nr:biopolymer transporter ExbD [Bacteroidota bacterium]